MRINGLFGEVFDDAEIKQRRSDLTNADRQARFVSARTDIGTIPDIVNPERRAKAAGDIVAFGMAYCRQTPDYPGGLLERDPSEDIEAYARDIQTAIEGGGMLHVRISRGGGKTAWCKIGILWAVSNGKLSYPVTFAATSELSREIIDDIWSVMEDSPNFAEDYPEIAHPIKALEGIAQRCAGQHYQGERTKIRHTASLINLPRIKGSLSSGSIIAARGANCACRGLSKKGKRPDFVMFDDVQTRKDAESILKTGKLEQWQKHDALGLAGKKTMAAVKTSTPIKVGDDSDRHADPELHPEWRTINYPLIKAWPRAKALWAVYDDLWKAAQQENDPAAIRATEHYRIHQEEMDEGFEVLDPGNYDDRFELSAYQHARNVMLRLGEEAFMTEFQLQPPRQDQSISLTAKDVAAKINGTSRRVLPYPTLTAVAFVDIMKRAGLHYTVLACGPQATSAIIDYGIYPEHGVIAPDNATELQIQQALAAAIVQLLDRLLSTQYVTASGRVVRLHAIWLDHGWQTKVVTRICDLYRQRGHANVYTCKGFDNSDYKDGAGKNVVNRGWQVDQRERDGVTFFGANSDYWKEQVQRAFLGVPLQPGTISLFGSNPIEHDDFASHIAAEILTDKATSSRGLDLYKWSLRPGSINHFLDTVAGALAAASWYRFWDGGAVVAKTILDASQVITPSQSPSSVLRNQRLRTQRYRSASPVE